MRLLSQIYILFFAKKVGTDEFGNKYYEKKDLIANRKRRFIIYKGTSEASKIPAEWEAWLRKTTLHTIDNTDLFWQKSHLPNLSGTNNQYNPKKFNSKNKSYNSYKPWQPK